MTIAGSVLRMPGIPVNIVRQRCELSDGDFVDLERLPGRSDDSPLIVICHGLEGSSEAGYVRGLMAQAQERGLGSVALNFRGCSGEPNRLARSYHSGETADLAQLIERLVDERQGRPIGICGFSLGGNVTVKYLGERGAADLPSEVRAACVVSVPFDLDGCGRALDGPGFFPFIYRERFLRKLRKKAQEKWRRFPECIDRHAAFAARTIREFDDKITAPLHGFTGADDYYARSSSARYLHGVERPLLVIHASDDPFIPPSTVPLDELRKNPAVTLELFDSGGHVAFLDGMPWRLERYAEKRAAQFLDEQLTAASA